MGLNLKLQRSVLVVDFFGIARLGLSFPCAVCDVQFTFCTLCSATHSAQVALCNVLCNAICAMHNALCSVPSAQSALCTLRNFQTKVSGAEKVQLLQFVPAACRFNSQKISFSESDIRFFDVLQSTK